MGSVRVLILPRLRAQGLGAVCKSAAPPPRRRPQRLSSGRTNESRGFDPGHPACKLHAKSRVDEPPGDESMSVPCAKVSASHPHVSGCFLRHRAGLDGGAPGQSGLLDLIRWCLLARTLGQLRAWWFNLGGRTLASPAIIDLFAGAGGLSVGALACGGDVRLLVDHDADSCETARRNHPHHVVVLQADVAELTGEQLRASARVTQNEPLIIIGGPPCQPFSKAAYWLEPGAEAQYRRERASGLFPTRPEPLSEARSDNRRSLVEEFWRLLREANADAFVFENVPSILHPRNRPVAEALIESAEKVGYHVTMVRGTATSFGVAQKRERVFVLASRHQKPLAPKLTHSVNPGVLRGARRAGCPKGARGDGHGTVGGASA